MLKNVQIRIDDPCSANWDQMLPKEQGRFCSYPADKDFLLEFEPTVKHFDLLEVPAYLKNV